MNTRLQRLWWLHPAWLFALVIGITMFAAAMQSDTAYRLYGAPKYIATSHVILTIAAIVVFAVGCRLASVTGNVPQPTSSYAERMVFYWFVLLTSLTLLGYAVWLMVGIKNGFSLSTLRSWLSSDNLIDAEDIRGKMFLSVKGVTTCTQFGVAAVPMGLWLYFHGYRRVIWPVLLLILVAAVRALVFSERLAFIELAVPATVVFLRARVLGRSWRPFSRAVLWMAPMIGIVGLVLLFGAGEYFRSWRHYQRHFDSFSEFTMWRIVGYYTTAHNNGAMAIETHQSYPLPYATLRNIWTLPGLDSTPLAYDKLTGVDPVIQHQRMLERYGTPELNSEGGLFQPILDFGVAGYLVFWFVCGFIAGRLYRGFLVGSFLGLTLYPLVFLGTLETPRFLYLCYTRSFPAILVLLLVSWLAERSGRAISAVRSQPAIA